MMTLRVGLPLAASCGGVNSKISLSPSLATHIPDRVEGDPFGTTKPRDYYYGSRIVDFAERFELGKGKQRQRSIANVAHPEIFL
jgi:hypothetical protein